MLLQLTEWVVGQRSRCQDPIAIVQQDASSAMRGKTNKSNKYKLR